MIKKILVIDDSKVEQLTIAGFIRNYYECYIANNGNEALEILKNNYKNISAIITDIIMPKKNGYEVMKEIREYPAYLPIPIIVTTSLLDDETREKAISFGANSFITKPINRTILLHTIDNMVKLRESSVLIHSLMRDKLTGLLNRDSFFIEVEKIIKKKEPGYYTLSCFDIENFKVINDQYGMDKGDEVLINIATIINEFITTINGIACRYTSDKFGILYPTKYNNDPITYKNHEQTTCPKCINHRIRVRIGRYLINDLNIPINTMFDRATFAEESIKGRYDVYICEYNNEMLESVKAEQRIINSMDYALQNKEFIFFLQPQFNHSTKSMIGAEALVRWQKDGQFISPIEFIPVFEKNGFIYEMDKYIWEEVCKQLRKWLDNGIKPLPISINISRVDIYHDNFIEVLIGIISKYRIDHSLIHLEVTESAFSESEVIVERVNKLISLGFTVEIDDFGSGYSSLNTLKDVKAQVLKLDLKFLEKTKNTDRSVNIIESVIRMARWLGMAVIAEGVEDIEHADFLKSIGCFYIQGYFYSKPLPVSEYEKLFDASSKEQKLTRLITVKNLDNNDFWNARSMDTLVFNNYVGGACIFEFKEGKAELLRVNDQFHKELGTFDNKSFIMEENKDVLYHDERNKQILFKNIHNCIETKHESTCELELVNKGKKESKRYLRTTVRAIANTGERYLIYCVLVNITEQRRAQENEKLIAERMKAIMDNTKCGITAVVVNEKKQVNYILVNDRFFELLGYTRKQFYKEVKNAFDRIVTEDYDKTIEKLSHLKNAGDETTVTMRAIRRDGSMIWLRDDVSIIKLDDVDGLVQLSNFIDISEQAQAEEQEHRMYEQLQMIMKNINGGVTATILHEGKPNYILANDVYYEQIGYSRDEFEKKVFDKFSPIIPADRERIRKEFEEKSKTTDSYTLEYKIQKPNGEIRDIVAKTNVVNLIGVNQKVHLCIYNDITDIRQMQRKERDLTLQLQTIMNNISGGITATRFLDKDHIEIVFSNDYFYEMYGYTKEEWHNTIKDTLELIHPDDIEKTKAIVEKVVREKKAYTYEYRCYQKNGNIIWIQCRNTVIDDNNPKGVILLAVTTDVTELRVAEMNERKSALRLNAIMNNMTSAIIVTKENDDRIDYIFTNNKFFELLGYKKEEYLNKYQNKYGPILKDDLAYVRKNIDNSMRTKEPITFDYRVLNIDNEIVWIRHKIITTNIDNIIGEVQLSILEDITDKKKKEIKIKETTDKLEAIMAHAGNGITCAIINNNQYELILANDKYYEIIGHSKEEFITNSFNSFISFIHPEDRLNIEGILKKSNVIGTDKTVEFKVVKSNYQMAWIRMAITVTKLTGFNKPVQIAVFSDITLEKETNAQLEFLNQSAHDILSEPNNDKAINLTLNKLLNYFQGDRCYIIELDYDKMITNNTYEVCKESVISEKDELQNVPFTGTEFWYESLSKNEFYIINDINNCEIDQCTRELLASQEIKSLIIAPLYIENILVGFVGLDNPVKAINEVSRLIAIADYLAVLINRRDLNQKMLKNYNTIQMMMNDIPGGFCRFGIFTETTPKVLYVNEGLCSLLGFTSEEFLQKFRDNAYNLIFTQDLDKARKESFDSQIENGQFKIKCRLNKKDNSQIWVMVFGRFVSDENKLFLNAYFTDISEQKKEEEYQKQLLDNMLCGAALYEFDGKKLDVIHINKQYWELVKRDPVDYSNASIFEVIHEDDQQMVKNEILAAIRQKRSIKVDIRILCGDNKYKPFHVESNIKEKGNGIYQLFTSYSLLSEETMSIQQMIPIALSTIMSSSEDLSYVKDKNLHYLCVSKSIASLYGYNNERDIIGQKASEIISSPLINNFEKIDNEIIKTGKVKENIVEKIIKKDGTLLILNSSKYPLIDTNGNVIGVYGTSRDITEQSTKDSQLDLLNSTIPGGIAAFTVIGNDIKIIYFNESFYDFTGYTREEFIEKSDKDPIFLASEKDKIDVMKLIERLKNNPNTIESYEYRCQMKNGDYKWMCVKARLSKVSNEKSIINIVQLDINDQKNKEEKLRLSEEAYKIATSHSDLIICKYDVSTKKLFFNDAISKQFSVSNHIDNIPYSAIEKNLVSEDTSKEYIKFYEDIINGEKTGKAVFQKIILKKWEWIEASFTTIFDENNKPSSAIISYKKCTEQREKDIIYNKWQQSLKSKNNNYFMFFGINLSTNKLYDSIEGGLYNCDYMNKNTNFSEISKKFINMSVNPIDKDRYYSFIQTDTLLSNFYQGKRFDTIEFRSSIYNGENHWVKLSIELVENNNSSEIIAFLMYDDINVDKENELHTKRMAETDSLTGLLNRNAFITLMKEKIAVKNDETHAFMIIDVDEFKLINDIYGHLFGDQVLVDIGKAIRSIISNTNYICRLGGDEYLIFINEDCNKETIIEKSKKIINIIKNGFNLDIHLTISIGISMYPSDGETFDSLYLKADKALYYVKEHGKNNIALYDDTMEHQIIEKKRKNNIDDICEVTTKKQKLLIISKDKYLDIDFHNAYKDKYEISIKDYDKKINEYLKINAFNYSLILLDLYTLNEEGLKILKLMKSDNEISNIPVMVIKDNNEESTINVIKLGACDYITKPINFFLLSNRIDSILAKSENDRLRAQNHYLRLHRN